MPHWCLSFTIWLRCWAQFITQLDDKAGGYGADENPHYLAMRNGLIGLQNMATTLMQASSDQDAQLLLVAHLIMARLHRLCVSSNPAVLREPLSMMEEREASNRAAAVTVQRPSAQPGQHPPRGGNQPNKKARQTSSTTGQHRNGNGGGRPATTAGPREGCPYHGFTKQHTLFQCNIFKELSPRSQSSASSATANQG